jgi:hypothetical protein
MSKPRKHPWVTECIKAGESVLSVWPSEEEVATQAKVDKFLTTIEKIGNDPRVTGVEEQETESHGTVYLFTIEE